MQLKRVNLNDNAVGYRGIKCIRRLLQNSSIDSFFLENCGLSAEDGAGLKEILTTECVGRKLRELSLGRNQMGAAGAAHIGDILKNEKFSDLQLFCYAGSRPQPSGTKDLCKALAEVAKHCGARGTMLHTLDLTEVSIESGKGTEDPISDLCYALRNSPRLQKLSLRDGGLSIEGLTMVLEALQVSGAPLIKLDLGYIGDLGKHGGQIIRDFMLSSGPASTSLQELYLDANNLGDDGVTEILIGVAVSCRSLQVLDIGENELVSITGCLQENHINSLHTLKLKDNPDLEDGEDLDVLRRMYKEVLVSNDDDDDETGVDALADILDSTKI
jgi:Ran GTPase-activating protein (RanGAP) involved in mRNA processing and transport